MHNIRKHWTTVLTLLGPISSVYRDLHQQSHIKEPKLYNYYILFYQNLPFLHIYIYMICNRYYQSEPESNGNEGVLHIPQNFWTGTSPSDYFVSYLGHLFGEGSYSSAEIHLIYSQVPLWMGWILNYFWF